MRRRTLCEATSGARVTQPAASRMLLARVKISVVMAWSWSSGASGAEIRSGA